MASVRQKAHGVLNVAGDTISFPAQTLPGSVVVWMICWPSYTGNLFPNNDDAGNLVTCSSPRGFNGATSANGPPVTVGSESWFGILADFTTRSNFCQPMQTITFQSIGGGAGPTVCWMFEVTGMQEYHSGATALMAAQHFTQQNTATLGSENDLNGSAQNPMYSPAGTAYGAANDPFSQNIRPSDSSREYFIVTCIAPNTVGGGTPTIASVDAPFTLEPVQNGFGCAWKISPSGYDSVADRAVFHNGAAAFYSAVWMAIDSPAALPPGTITVIKNTFPSGSAQTFTVRPSWSAPITVSDGSFVPSGPLTAGVYDISEDAIPGWVPSITVSNGDPASAINVADGDNITVAILNTQTVPAPPGGDKFIPRPPAVAGTVQNIPLDNSPNQVWKTTVLVEGVPVTVNITLRYNEIAKYWTATIRDIDGNLVLDSLPFVTGTGISQNLLGQFAYLGIGSACVFNASQVS